MAKKFIFPVRLDRFLSNSGYGSRKDIKTALKQNLIEVNGEICLEPDKKIMEGDRVLFRGEPVGDYRYFYWAFHKPAGYICSNYDPGDATIFELIEHPLADEMQIAGRLDKDVTGLVILTNDGEFNHILTSPKHLIAKHYQAELAENLTDDQVERLLKGVDISEGVTVTAVRVRHLDAMLYEISVTSGQYHVVKKMISGAGADLIHLHRVGIGDFRLGDDLVQGGFRELEPDELEMLSHRWE